MLGERLYAGGGDHLLLGHPGVLHLHLNYKTTVGQLAHLLGAVRQHVHDGHPGRNVVLAVPHYIVVNIAEHHLYETMKVKL